MTSYKDDNQISLLKHSLSASNSIKYGSTKVIFIRLRENRWWYVSEDSPLEDDRWWEIVEHQEMVDDNTLLKK